MADTTVFPDVVAITPVIPAPNIVATPRPSAVVIAPVINAPGLSRSPVPAGVAITPNVRVPLIRAGTVNVASVVAITVSVPSARAGNAPGVVAITVSIPFSGPPPTTILLQSSSTLFPERVGATVASVINSGLAPDTSAATVIAGITSRIAGAAAILTGDYAFRGMYQFRPSASVPLPFFDDGRSWVTLASWGDFQLLIRRDRGTGYTVRADFITASVVSTFATGILNLSNDIPTTLSIGVTRDVTTGLIRLWRSEDDWTTWVPLLTGSSSIEAGALADSIPDPIVLVGGDLTEGPWVSVMQAHWGATDDINAVDAAEVAAWNYGANIVTGLGGDFYDDIDRTVKNLWELGTNSSYIYKQRSETTSGGTTVRSDFTINAGTINTSEPPAGTAAAFTYDASAMWENGPASSVLSPPILLSGTSLISARPMVTL